MLFVCNPPTGNEAKIQDFHFPLVLLQYVVTLLNQISVSVFPI